MIGHVNWILLPLLVLSLTSKTALAGCYFPLEFQGEFLTQSMTSREIAYSSLSVLFDSIPSWGTCHRRLGHHVILEENDQTCFKCISMVSRSPNVIQIHSNGIDQCHPTEELARQNCPTQQEVRERKAQEMMFYKTRAFYGGSAISKTYCPLNGKFKFTYSINDGTEDDLECHEPLSEATDCPTGYKFDLHFKGCSFPDFDMSFQCLASWPGENGETYLSLLDTKLPQLGEEARPRYRCALFKEDSDTGLTHVALSSDSTCVNHLYSAQDGYETLHLEKLAEEEPETPAHPQCIFPDWMQGQWEGVTIEGGEMVYRDETNFQTFRGKCLQAANADRFVVHLKTDCGSAAHYCALFQQRDVNVMEFQLGVSSSDSSDLALCNVENFSPSKWLTMGRSHILELPHCPLVGEYTGVIPDAEGLCAKSYADCNNPEVMFYTVFNCQNQTEVYEEREYRCFGQWEEDGLVYTYTKRQDLPGNECFVGVTIDENQNMVTEAGQNCERGHQPLKYGMTLQRQAKCSHEKPFEAVTQTPFTPPDFMPSSNEDTLSDLEDEEEIRLLTDRPVSPRLSSTTKEGLAVSGDSSDDGHHGHKKTLPGKRHHHKHGGRATSTVAYDIYSNEIPGSGGSGAQITSSPTQMALLTISAVMLALWCGHH